MNIFFCLKFNIFLQKINLYFVYQKTSLNFKCYMKVYELYMLFISNEEYEIFISSIGRASLKNVFNRIKTFMHTMTGIKEIFYR